MFYIILLPSGYTRLTDAEIVRACLRCARGPCFDDVVLAWLAESGKG